VFTYTHIHMHCVLLSSALQICTHGRSKLATVSFARPTHGARLESREVSFEIHTTDFKMPEQGKVEVFVNERRAFEVESPVMVVKAPVDAGFHTVQVRLEPAPPALLLCLPWQIPRNATLTLNSYSDCALRCVGFSGGPQRHANGRAHRHDTLLGGL
jgi:hypothetical protein